MFEEIVQEWEQGVSEWWSKAEGVIKAFLVFPLVFEGRDPNWEEAAS